MPNNHIQSADDHIGKRLFGVIAVAQFNCSNASIGHSPVPLS